MIEYTNSDIETIINEYIHKERDRNLLKRRYMDGITHEKLAEEFNLSVKQVKNIIYKHKDLIFDQLKTTRE